MRNSRNVKSFSRGYLRFACFFPVEPFFPGAGLFFRFAVAPERPGAERLPAAIVFSGYFFPEGTVQGQLPEIRHRRGDVGVVENPGEPFRAGAERIDRNRRVCVAFRRVENVRPLRILRIRRAVDPAGFVVGGDQDERVGILFAKSSAALTVKSTMSGPFTLYSGLLPWAAVVGEMTLDHEEESFRICGQTVHRFGRDLREQLRILRPVSDEPEDGAFFPPCGTLRDCRCGCIRPFCSSSTRLRSSLRVPFSDLGRNGFAPVADENLISGFRLLFRDLLRHAAVRNVGGERRRGRPR